MPTQRCGEVTRLLCEIQGGDEKAKDELFNLVYRELHELAEIFMRGERKDHILQPTALISEAVIRLIEGKVLDKAQNGRFFFGAAAKAMRQVLVEYARKRKAQKRGGDWKATPLDDVLDFFERENVDLAELDTALDKLAKLHERQHEVIHLRLFGGLGVKQVADFLGVSVGTVEGDFRKARAFLRAELAEGE